MNFNGDVLSTNASRLAISLPIGRLPDDAEKIPALPVQAFLTAGHALLDLPSRPLLDAPDHS